MPEPTSKETAEIFKKGARLTAIKKMPFVKREKIWDEYNKFINSLEQSTFDNNIISLIKMLNYGEKSCSEFPNGDAQVEVSLKRWPRLVPYRGALLEWIKENRKDHGFEE